MAGRDKFDKYFSIIRFLCLICRFLPGFFRHFLWNLIKPFDGSVALALRYILLSVYAECLGRNIYVGSNVIIKNPGKLLIGDNVSIHDYCYIDAIGSLKIGDNVSIAHNSSLITFNHTWHDHDLPIKYNVINCSPISIEDDVWIGCGVRIMPGVTIGRRSVIAAGAVVTSDVPEGCLVAGVPARVIRSIAE